MYETNDYMNCTNQNFVQGNPRVMQIPYSIIINSNKIAKTMS